MILITGSSGLLGKDVSKFISNQGIPTLRLGNKNLSDDVLSCDLSDPEQVQKLPNVVTGIVHCAAYVPAIENEADPLIADRVNTLGTLNLLDKYHSCPWVLISSGSIEKDSDRYFSDISNLSHSNFYEATKHAAEIYAGAYSRAFNFPLTILRCSYIYGDGIRESTVIIKLIKAALEHGTLNLGEAGQRRFNFIHTSDIARASQLALTKSHSGKYFIGSLKTTSVLELGKKIEKEMGKKLKFEVSGSPPQQQLAQPHDMEQLREKLGWIPEYPINLFLQNMIGFYSKK